MNIGQYPNNLVNFNQKYTHFFPIIINFEAEFNRKVYMSSNFMEMKYSNKGRHALQTIIRRIFSSHSKQILI